MMPENNWLELNFLIQFIRCWKYSGHIFLLKFNSSEVNVLQIWMEFVMYEFEYAIGILFRVFFELWLIF